MSAWKNKRIGTFLQNSATIASLPALCMVATLALTAARGAEPSRENDAVVVNNKQVVSACYRDGLGRWQALSAEVDVSAANHNKLGGWGSVRPALFACGAGQARFYSFTYRPL